MKQLKILGVSSIRSDYDLLAPLYLKLNEDHEVDFKLLVGGTHISSTFGRSLKEIEKDNLPVLHKVESLLDSDTPSGRLKSALIFSMSVIDTINNWNPDIIVFAGDREDALAIAQIGAYLSIPTVHFYGGDHTQDGYVDNPVRHAISKLVTAHFVSCKSHEERLLSIGEEKKRIHVVGSIALDRLSQQTMGTSKAFEALSLMAQPKYALVIYHPIEEDQRSCRDVLVNILESLKAKGVFGIVSSPNSDPMSRQLLEVVRQYEKDPNFYFYKNLERETFTSLYKGCAFIIGNSSSGILEAATYKKPAINVGNRQKGRMAEVNVLFVETSASAIAEAITKVQSEDFMKDCNKITNPYGDGHSASRAHKLLKTINFRSSILKKHDPLQGITHE